MTSYHSKVFCAYVKQETGLTFTPEYRFDKIRRWRFDYACIIHKIAIEVEGGVWKIGRHNRPKGFIGDMEKYNTAASLGWTVIRVTPDNLYSQSTIDLIQKTLHNRKAI
jgi:very-short-patch-repair endonuclease